MDKTEIEINGIAFKSVPPEQGAFCFGCAFYEGPYDRLCSTSGQIQPCSPVGREDRQHIIWVLA